MAAVSTRTCLTTPAAVSRRNLAPRNVRPECGGAVRAETRAASKPEAALRPVLDLRNTGRSLTSGNSLLRASWGCYETGRGRKGTQGMPGVRRRSGESRRRTGLQSLVKVTLDRSRLDDSIICKMPPYIYI
jgi:hypothetical protein